LHQVGDLFELDVKLRCQKVKACTTKVSRSPIWTVFGLKVNRPQNRL